MPTARFTPLKDGMKVRAHRDCAHQTGVFTGTVRPDMSVVPIAQKWHCSVVPQ